MGFRVRKSVGSGGFRVNISKSGIGYSCGVKGMRYTKKANGGTRTTISVPGTGISHVHDSSNKKVDHDYNNIRKTSTEKTNGQKSNNFKTGFIVSIVFLGLFLLGTLVMLIEQSLKITDLFGSFIYAIGLGILSWFLYKKWKAYENLAKEDGTLVSENTNGNDLETIKYQARKINELSEECRYFLNEINYEKKFLSQEIGVAVDEIVVAITSRVIEANEVLESINNNDLISESAKIQDCLLKFENIANELLQLKIDLLSKPRFTYPENYEVVEIVDHQTKLRGVYYQNITKYDIDEEMPVVIQHRPTQEFPEKVEVVTLDSGLLLGHLEKEMAEDFVANYGNNFRLNGYIEEFELKSDEENFDADVDMMDEDLVTKIIVTYGKPRFRKVK